MSLQTQIQCCLSFKKCCAIAGWIIYSCANAQTTPLQDLSAIRQQSDQLLREEQQRQQEQLRRDQESSKSPTRLDAPLVAPKSRPAGPCRDVQKVSIEGATLLSLSLLESITARYAMRCLGVNDIEMLLADLTNAYISAGYATVRAYLPQQDLSGGTLKILVIEGRVEKILIEDGGNNSISIGNVAPGVVGKPLNLRDFEQALDQVNRLASNNATFDIQPGSETGDSIVVIGNQPTRTYRGNLSYDNQGSVATGQEQTGANVSWDSPLGLNDFVSLTHRRATPYDSQGASSWSNSLNYILPYGYSTLVVSLSNSAYTSAFKAPSGSILHSSGTSEQMSMRLDRTIYRNQSDRWNLAASVTAKDSKSYLEDVFLAVSSRRLSILDLDSSYTTRFVGGVLTLDLGYAHGLKLFNALEDAENLPSDAPKAQFDKWKFGLSYMVPFKAAGLDWALNSALVGQKAGDVLYGSEQIYIGGIYTVRGFVKNTLAGDSGFYWRNDLSFRVPFNVPGEISGMFRPYIALDHGYVKNRIDSVPDGSLSGMAVGFSLSVGKVSFDLFSTHPLRQPEFMRHEGNSTFLRLNLSL
jgi:hemolysin activation/secretion protein